jgi:DHA2 family multidrug resistance protein
MIVVGRIVQKVDVRLIMGTGFALIAVALWQMTGMTLQMDSRLVIVSGFIQGLGVGLTFVPLSTAAFATLPAHLRHDGTPVFSLLRNIGASVGISIVQALLAVFAAGAHERLAENVNPYNPILGTLPQAMSPSTAAGLALINGEVTRQATLIAYLGDFRLMMVMAMAAIPLLLLIRRPARATGGAPAIEAAH